MSNMEIWQRFCTTPKEAQKTIDAGRLKGFTDINPMWRFKALTETFGPCGIGWKIDIKDYRIEDGAAGERKAFVFITISYKQGDSWSEPVPGFGGAAFVSKENPAFTPTMSVSKWHFRTRSGRPARHSA